MSTKIGRPKSNNPKNIRLEIRLNKDEEEKLNECCNKLNLNKTNVLMKGLDKVYEEIKK